MRQVQGMDMIGQYRRVREYFSAWYFHSNNRLRPLVGMSPGTVVIVFDVDRNHNDRVVFTTKDGITLETTHYRIQVLSDPI